MQYIKKSNKNQEDKNMKRKKKYRKTRHITIRISEEMFNKLEKRAIHEDTTISKLGREGLAFILSTESYNPTIANIKHYKITNSHTTANISKIK